MTDYFVLTGEKRRPWLDPDTLKQKFLELSAAVHPDRVHNADVTQKQKSQHDYTELNAAYQCLREPKERLRHLIELERGTKPEQVQRIPPDLMNLSLEIGQVCRLADGIIAERAKTTSPLLQVNLFERAQQEIEKLTVLQRKLEGQHSALLNLLREFDVQWDSSGTPGSAPHTNLLTRLEELYRLLSYYERWNSQVRERIAQLSF